jgi:hypothetical protein
LAWAALSGLGPMRWFTWCREQRHRPGLEFLLSTGRLHGFDSLEEAQLLLALDFAGEVVKVLPLRLVFTTVDGKREHTPDFLVLTRGPPPGAEWTDRTDRICFPSGGHGRRGLDRCSPSDGC